jgi:hypothetical protein
MTDALVRIENYFTTQNEWPENYSNFTFDSIRKIYEDNVIELMPNCDTDGATVIIFRMKNWDTRKSFIHDS